MGSIIAYEEDSSQEDGENTTDTNNEQDEEPFELSLLSTGVIKKIIDKMDFNEYRRFEEVSRLTHDVCNSHNFHVPFDVPDLSINKSSITMDIGWFWQGCKPRKTRFHAATSSAAKLTVYNLHFPHRVSGNRLRAVAKLFKKNRTIIHSMYITEHILFSPEDLDYFLAALTSSGLTYIHFTSYVSDKFFLIPNFQKINSLRLQSTSCQDEEFLKMKCKSLYMRNENITARGLNRFLKQWKRKEREIDWIEIEFDTSFNTRNFDTILLGLDASIIWTPDTHKDSMVAAIPFEELPMVSTGDAHHLYSIMRSDDIGNTFLLRLTMGRFEFYDIHSESQHIFGEISTDQYYVIMTECQYCSAEFCEHRRRFSTQRFKKFFPQTNDFIIAGFKLAGFMFAAFECKNVIGGVTYPVQPMCKDDFDRLLHENRARTFFRKSLYLLRASLFNR